MSELTCKPDYEAMYNELVKEHAKLKEELKYRIDECTYQKEALKSLEQEFHSLRAQMDIVYLIFGGNKWAFWLAKRRHKPNG